jgi:hypothetical protein
VLTSATNNVYRGVDLQLAIPATELTSIKITFDMTVGTPYPSTAADNAIAIEINGGNHSVVTFAALATGAGQVAVWSGDIASVTQIGIFIASGYDTISLDPGGSVTVTKIEISGKGTKPTALSGAGC